MDESLRALEAGEGLLAELSRLTVLLESNPSGRRAIRELLNIIEDMAEPLTIR